MEEALARALIPFLVWGAAIISPQSMNSTSTQYVTSRRMGLYEPIHQISMWGDFKGNVCPNTSASMIIEVETKLDDQSEDTSHGTLGPSNNYDQEASKPDKIGYQRLDYLQVLRRLAQNREAARKSRLRKKAYVQQLETSRLKLLQVEQELERVRQQGAYLSGGYDASQFGYSGNINPGIAAFEMEYGQWVEDQNRQLFELRAALHSQLADLELRILVDGAMNHYSYLFRMKATAAKADVFYLMSGMWKTPAERFFLWIGGFRPSELLKISSLRINDGLWHTQTVDTKKSLCGDCAKGLVLLPHLDLLDQQLLEVCNLRRSCQQAEDALSQGMDKLQQTLAEAVAAGRLGEGSDIPQMSNAMERLEALVSFVNQADHLRQETLQQMDRILTTRQAAQGLLALGEYFQRLRALSLLWANRPREPN
ncbi:hypothetical protein RJ639_016851 [Escallonia herrerae]|uniref:DOG1 domain-containing protein n=1 Tax=Escallonia herrerae TaxID=1293975 RepID=A0AA89AMF3_9ASTE|nr:hypothetical protein RJ639_016851 [Escallonia herrerae]